MKIFINYKPENVPYGGGNIFSINFINYLKLNNNEIVYDFEKDIDIFFIIDPFKGKFKKYGLDEIVKYKKNNNHKGKIVIRINDCDKTRPNVSKERSREHKILQHYQNINYFIFNSKFIQEYYMNKYTQLKNIKFYKSDIMRYESKKKYNLIIFLAGIASPTIYKKYPIESLEVSYLGAKKFLEKSMKIV